MDREPQIDTRTVRELSGLRLKVPHYQRGYRWDKQNVKQLLSDLKQFDHENHTQKYSLQPLIVAEVEDGVYDLIDGQQRLTTLELILKYAHQPYPGTREDGYEIEYETRPDSKSFLASLGGQGDTEASSENADYYYMQMAWEAIDDWRRENNIASLSFLTDIAAKIQEDVMLIWYQVSKDVNPIELFRRVNIGRIPLTSSELVKALLLTNASESDHKDISRGWEDLERRLQDDQLWYFLTNGKPGTDARSTRVDLVLDVWHRMRKSYIEGPRSDGFGPFHMIDSVIQESRRTENSADAESEVRRTWQELKDIFSQLEYWFTDHSLYHRVGFLLAIGHSPAQLFSRLASLDKDALHKEIMEAIKDGLRVSGEPLTAEMVGSLEWTTAKDAALIKKLLLLFNVETILADGDDYVRFSFEAFKKEQWDLEHIHALAERPPRDDQGGAEARRKYFVTLKREIETVLTDETLVSNAVARLSKAIDEDEFLTMSDASEVVRDSTVRDALERLAASWNELGNLALLDAATNRGYGNDTFPEKRKDIIERQRGARFIPVGTRNVFLGYYRQDPDGSARWTEEDQHAYVRGRHGILETLADYLESEDDEEN